MDYKFKPLSCEEKELKVVNKLVRDCLAPFAASYKECGNKYSDKEMTRIMNAFMCEAPAKIIVAIFLAGSPIGGDYNSCLDSILDTIRKRVLSIIEESKKLIITETDELRNGQQS